MVGCFLSLDKPIPREDHRRRLGLLPHSSIPYSSIPSRSDGIAISEKAPIFSGLGLLVFTRGESAFGGD